MDTWAAGGGEAQRFHPLGATVWHSPVPGPEPRARLRQAGLHLTRGLRGERGKDRRTKRDLFDEKIPEENPSGRGRAQGASLPWLWRCSASHFAKNLGGQETVRIHLTHVARRPKPFLEAPSFRMVPTKARGTLWVERPSSPRRRAKEFQGRKR